MVVVAMVAVVVTKVLVWTAAIVNMVVEVEALVVDVCAGVVVDTLHGVDIIVMPAIVSDSELAGPISYFVDVLSDMVVDALVEAVAEIIMVFVTGIDVEVLNVNAFAFLTTALEFDVPKPL